jgi:hypothetical protein
MGILGLPPLGRFGISAAACASSALVAFAVVPSCTVFNDVIVEPAPDAGQDAAPMGNPPTNFLSLADGADVCSKVAACPELAASITLTGSVPIDPVNFSACMTWVAGPIPANRIGVAIQTNMLTCFAAADSCLTAGSCLAFEIMAPGDARCDGMMPLERCSTDGLSVLYCDGFNQALNCANPVFAPGSTCLAGQNGALVCSFGPTCNVINTCNGPVHEFCTFEPQLPVGFDCAASGNTCGVDATSGGADCLTDGRLQLCSGTGSDCDGDRVTVCNGDVLSVYDCADMGGTCSKELGSPRCVRPSDTCTPFDPDVNVCTGSSIKLCVGGEKVDFDCASLGKTCAGSRCM